MISIQPEYKQTTHIKFDIRL